MWTPSFVLLIVLNLFTNAGFAMTMPTLPQYAVGIGMSLPMAGALSGVFSIIAIVARPVAGMLADRYNQKKMLLLSTFAVCLATFGYSLSTNISVLFAFRLLHGIAFSFSSTTNMTLATSLIPENRMGEGIGYLGISQIVAMSFAPNLGLLLAEQTGYAFMFQLSAMSILIATVTLLFLPHRHQYKVAAAEKKLSIADFVAFDLLLLALMGGLFSIANGAISAFLAMLGAERGIASISLFFTVSSAAVLLVRPLAGRLMDKKGLGYILLPSFVLCAAAMIGISLAEQLGIIIVAAVLKGASQSSGQSCIQAECVRRTPFTRRGVAMATCYLGNDLGNGVGPVVGGWLSANWGYGMMFMVIGLVLLLGLALYCLQLGIDRRRVPQIG